MRDVIVGILDLVERNVDMMGHGRQAKPLGLRPSIGEQPDEAFEITPSPVFIVTTHQGRRPLLKS